MPIRISVEIAKHVTLSRAFLPLQPRVALVPTSLRKCRERSNCTRQQQNDKFRTSPHLCFGAHGDRLLPLLTPRCLILPRFVYGFCEPTPDKSRYRTCGFDWISLVRLPRLPGLER